MEEPAGANQRRASRQPLVRFIWFKLIDEIDVSDDAPGEGIAHSCDISLGGAGITVAQPYPVGARIFIEIAAGSFTLSAVGRVAHVGEKGGQYRIGIEFVVMPPNDRIRLRQLCDAPAENR